MMYLLAFLVPAMASSPARETRSKIVAHWCEVRPKTESRGTVEIPTGVRFDIIGDAKLTVSSDALQDFQPKLAALDQELENIKAAQAGDDGAPWPIRAGGRREAVALGYAAWA
ncbi:MAG: hypothetical protein R3F61_39130 [Myxococcota bacterium]